MACDLGRFGRAMAVALVLLHSASVAALAASPCDDSEDPDHIGETAAYAYTAPASARTSRRGARKGANEDARYYAAFVLDANTGRVLHADQADELRRPASLTKVMTLYLLFEKLEAGAITLDTEMPVSVHASVQEPTKLYVQPGQTLSVKDAILGLVTKSANDAAVVVAEALGGTEPAFALQMTAKARELGMTRTVYRNASGLPDDAQVTTARDQVTLGRAIQARFPRYSTVFATRSFTWRGCKLKNHNHLLGKVAGMDGIKTGYTRASKFNLLTSVRRNDRHIVAVVLGGTTARSRDARMKDLIEQCIVSAAPQKDQLASAGPARPRETDDEPR